ncbi:hypothetical protein BC938DRAFT_479477 [Jimgerdemannia flammicorona]|uniref:Zn(2)-C6 fungal-type domain-containing protein n=1 Tax=Jimgerdemannia flammicorona TaxID=994334 RepID=A0A433QKS7_9FUNG|nr:hypothetical protein BC938DRAFT_479477 [Jimgerdemannia flammicorona]
MNLNATFDSSFHRKRIPCQSCRRDRRKCIPNSHDNDGPCYRCERMKLQCVYEPFKETEKPEELEEDEDLFEMKTQMIGDVAELQRQLASFEKEVVALRPNFPALEAMVGLGTGIDGAEIITPGSPWSSDSTITQLTTDDKPSSSTMDASMSTPVTTFSDDAGSVTTVTHPTKRCTANLNYQPDLEISTGR